MCGLIKRLLFAVEIADLASFSSVYEPSRIVQAACEERRINKPIQTSPLGEPDCLARLLRRPFRSQIDRVQTEDCFIGFLASLQRRLYQRDLYDHGGGFGSAACERIQQSHLGNEYEEELM